MKDRALVAAVVVLAFLATVVDFASKILSVFADGVMMAGLCGAVVLLYRHQAARLESVRQERDELQRRLDATWDTRRPVFGRAGR